MSFTPLCPPAGAEVSQKGAVRVFVRGEMTPAKLPRKGTAPVAVSIGGRIASSAPQGLAHIYGTEPVPTSYVLPFLIEQTKGTYGTALTASLPQVTGEWGFVTGAKVDESTAPQVEVQTFNAGSRVKEPFYVVLYR